MIEKWWHKSVIYQIYPKSFLDNNDDGIGDIKGIIKKLPYLEKLGIDVIWLSPVYKSPMKDNGYDISDYQQIDPMFGNMVDIDELIKQSLDHNIKIVMDLVVNHTSDQHAWFTESRKNKTNQYRDYYIWRDEPSDLGSTFGGNAWEYDETTKQYYYHNFAVEQPDLNWENPKILDEICNMINWWLEKGVGGFRLDVIDLIGKEIDKKILGNGPRLHPLLKEINKRTFGNYDVMTVGETWGASPEIAALYSDPNREELSMVFQFEHMTLDWGIHGKWSPQPLDFIELKKVLSKWQTKLGNGWNSLFWNNHDLPRIVSRWGNDSTYRVESAKMLAVTLHMMKGTPYIFQGEEIGMTNIKHENISDYNDVEIHGFYNELVKSKKLITHDDFMDAIYKMGRDNARTPMQWNRNSNAGFSKSDPWLKLNDNYSSINVEDSLEDPNSIFYTYQEVIKLRKHSAYSDTILYGDFSLLLPDDENVFAYTRKYDNQSLLIISNFKDQEVEYKFNLDDYKIIYSNYEENRPNFLKPFESIILSK